MTLRKKSQGVYTDDSAIKKVLDRVDAIVFDCDGVLIDITKSYDMAIIKTARHVLEKIVKVDTLIDVDFKIIDGFKSTGGFNDEVDLTYAAVISLAAAKKLGKDQTNFIFEVIRNSDSTGIVSVEKYIEKQVDISGVKKQLSYPGIGHESPLSQIFDQLFYGPELYQKLFNRVSSFSDPGLIEQDDVILDEVLIQRLQKKFGSKIAMVTGRGKESVGYSLKLLLAKFDLSHSMFLEDEPRKLAKPNPQSLLSSIDGMKSISTIYVGDSMEDLIMAKKATADLGHETIFCGIIGTSKNPQDKLDLFEKNGAILVLDSIHQLPKALDLDL